MRDLDVVLCGYYGFGNLGDDLLAESIVALLDRCGIPPKRVGILCATPAKTEAVLGVVAANRWSLGDVRRLLKRSKTVLLGGGGLFQDTTSVRSCLYYWGIVSLAHCCGCSVWAVGQSLGPFKTSLGRVLARSAFRRCRWIGVRDERSRALLAQWGMDSHLSPDLVMSLCLPLCDTIAQEYLLLNLRPWEPAFIEGALEEAGKLAVEYGLKTRCAALSPEDFSLFRGLEKEGRLVCDEIVLIASKEDFVAALDGVRAALGMRLHFCVLCVLSGIPVIAAAYDPKVSSFAEEWGLPLLGEVLPYPLKPVEEEAVQRARDGVAAVFERAVFSLFGRRGEA